MKTLTPPIRSIILLPMPTCKCGEVNEGRFYRRQNGSFRTPCKACIKLRRTAYDQKNSVPLKNHRTQYLLRNREHTNARNLRRMNFRREELTKITDGLKACPCKDCGKIYPPCVMDFDHVRGQKRAAIAVLVARCVSLETLLAEILKCDLRCANCHRVKTNAERHSWLQPRQKMTPWVQARRTALRAVADEAKSVPCGDCGSIFPVCVMDFDHIDPRTKRCNVSRMIHSEISLRELRAEIAKCRIICANCHRIRTHVEDADLEVPTFGEDDAPEMIEDELQIGGRSVGGSFEGDGGDELDHDPISSRRPALPEEEPPLSASASEVAPCAS